MSDHEYRQECRCEACRVESTARKRAYRAARVRNQGDDVPHGTQNGYVNWRCRCGPCRAAGQLAHERSCARRFLARYNVDLDDVVKQD